MSLEMYRAGVLREISERVPAGLGGPVVPPPVGAEAVGLLCADHTWQSPGLPDQAAELRIICAEGESPVALGGVIFNLIPGSKCFAVLRASRRSWSPVSLLSPQQVHPQPLCSPPRPGITLGAWRAWDSPRLRFLRRCWVHSNPLLLRNQASDGEQTLTPFSDGELRGFRAQPAPGALLARALVLSPGNAIGGPHKATFSLASPSLLSPAPPSPHFFFSF